MTKKAQLGLRLEPNVKDALEAAADKDSRSMSAYAALVLEQHLREAGYLK